MSTSEQEQRPREERVAARYLQRQGFARPKLGTIDEDNKVDGAPNLLAEGYDLFVERQQLRDYIVKQQRYMMEPSRSSPSLSLEQKRELIRQGKASTLLSRETTPEPYQEVVERSQSKIEDIQERLDQIFSQPGMYEEFNADLSRQVRVRNQAREIKGIRNLVNQLGLQSTKIAREAQVQHRSVTSVERQIVEENRTLREDAKQRIQELLKDPDVFDQLRILELQEYQRQLQTDGFVETPSRHFYMDQLEKLWGQDKKVLVTGATGTGKTELVRHASRSFFGIKPFEITGHRDMTPYELLGRTGMTVRAGEGSDVYRPSKLIQAMIARDNKGAPFLYDEMDASPNEANIALKTILNDGPGDQVSVQMDSQEKFVVGSDYSFTGTANVKSEKHATRFKIDPAIVRVLDPMILPYMPPDEVWDITVASLIDFRGGLPLSAENATGTLKNLCDAAFWTQQAYLGEKVVLDTTRGTFLEARDGATTGKLATLREAVLDPGKVIKMLNGWEAARLNGHDLQTFVDDQLVRFINNENYPVDDRYYLVRIFALKGFLKGKRAEEFSLNGLDNATLARWRGSQKESVANGGHVYIAPDRVARLDPYNKLQRPVTEDARELLDEELRSKDEVILSPDLMLERAKEVLGVDFLGIEAIKLMENKFKELGVDVEFLMDDIPASPYSEQDIQFAKTNGEMLALRIDRMRLNGKEVPITISTLHQLFVHDPTGELQSVIHDPRRIERKTTEKHSIFEAFKRTPPKPAEAPWWEEETFINTPLPLGWAITRKEVLDESVGKAWNVQDTVLNQYNSWLKRKKCTTARVPMACELVWDVLLNYAATGERVLKEKTSFTNTGTYAKNVATVGNFRDDGLCIGWIGGYNKDPDTGICPTR